jgi:probable FeS assembly SUF system protein SufT
VLLQKDTEVTITQALGGTYTVNIYGNLARIDSKDADALGKAVDAAIATADFENMSLEDLVWTQLKTCYDPEIPINIVDLGLVYECKIECCSENENGNENEYQILIKMTLTAPGCGMGPVIAADVKQKVAAIPGVKDAEVEIVFDPPWDREMMSEAAKLQLGVF